MHSSDYLPPTLPSLNGSGHSSNNSNNNNTAGIGFSSNVRVLFSAAQTLNAFSSSTIGSPTLRSSSRVPTSVSASSHSPTSPMPIGEEPKLSDLIAQKVAQQQFFYGIEVAARSYGPKPTVIRYDDFGVLLPLFTSLIWFGMDYWNVTSVAEVESLQLAHKLRQRTNVVPHFTCYRANRRRLKDFLDLNYTNVLALRGDHVYDEQEFQHAVDLVTAIREIRGNAVSIGVGAYPEGHPDSESLDKDIEYLLAKVNAGADFIVTQLCFSAEALQQFIRRCRSQNIRIPIVLGIFVPDNFRTLQRIVEITQVKPPPVDRLQYEALQHDVLHFREFAVERAAELIDRVLNDSAQANLNVYGVHFFTTNRFKCVQRVLQKLHVGLNDGNKNQIS